MVTAHGEVDIPGVGGQVSATQGRHRIEQKQGAVLVRQPGHLISLVHGASGGLVVYHGDQFVVATGQFLGEGVQVNERSPGDLEGIGFAAEAVHDAHGQFAKLPIDNGQSPIAAFNDTSNSTFEPATS